MLGNRVGVDRGLVRRVSYRYGDGFGRFRFGYRLALRALPIRRLPLGQHRLILLGCSREMICGDCPEH